MTKKSKLPMTKNMKVAVSVFFGVPAGCYAIAWWVKAIKLTISFATTFSYYMDKI